jgi:hypothetical protein
MRVVKNVTSVSLMVVLCNFARAVELLAIV